MQVWALLWSISKGLSASSPGTHKNIEWGTKTEQGYLLEEGPGYGRLEGGHHRVWARMGRDKAPIGNGNWRPRIAGYSDSVPRGCKEEWEGCTLMENQSP